MPFWNRSERRLRSFWRLVIFLGLLVLFELALARAGFSIASVDSFLVASLINFVFSVVLVAGATRLLDRRGLPVLGWTPSRRAWADMAFGVLLGVALISLVVGVGWAAGWYVRVLPRAGSLPKALGQTLLLFAAAGAYEEIVFRSYVLRNFADGLNHRALGGPRTALLAGTVLSSALFGLVHLGNPNTTVLGLVNVAVAGLFLAAGYVLTGRLALPVGLHIFWNFAQGSLYGLPVSGIDFGRSVLTFRPEGPSVLTGGAFGIEGGLLGLGAMILAIPATVAWVRIAEGRVALATALLTAPTAPATLPPGPPSLPPAEPPATDTPVLA